MIWSTITAIFGNRKPRRVRLKMTQQEAFGERLESRVVMSANTLNTAALQLPRSFDVEPNNTRGTADFVRSFGAGSHSTTVYGSTGSGTDTQDWGRFTLSGRTSGTIQLSGMAQDLDLELYNSSGTRIDRSIRTGTSADTITLTNLAAGTYYVRVIPGVTGARSAYALRFGLSVSTTPPRDSFDVEPNNTLGTAGFVRSFGAGSHSTTVYGSTGSGTDTQDWGRFTLSGRTSGTIQLSGMAQDLDLELYNSSGTRIDRSIRTGTSADTITLTNLAAGTYYVRVIPGVTGARSAYALRFGLSVSTTPPRDSFDVEPNNTLGTAGFVRSFGAGSHSTTVYGSTGSGTDTQDWGRFTVSGPTSGTIQLSGMTQDLDIELYNSRGSIIGRSIRTGTSTETITLTNLATGTYYVRVIPGVTGARSAYALRFRLTVTDFSAPCCGRPRV